MFICNRCQTIKEKFNFPPRKANKNKGIDGTCKQCHSELYKEYYNKKKAEGINLNDNRVDYKREWYQNNKVELRPYYLANTRKRNLQKINATPKWLTEDDLNEILNIYLLAKELENKDNIKRHVDHIIPLQNKKVCGLHVPWNLQILTSSENLKKGNKLCQEDVSAATMS